MANLSEVRVPDIGDFEGIDVIEVLVRPGDRVEPETSLITLESDKATMEVPSPLGGVVKYIAVKVGDKVSEGDLILSLETAIAPEKKPASTTLPASVDSPALEKTPAIPRQTQAESAPAAPGHAAPSLAAPANSHTTTGQAPYASPSVRRYARELGADLTRVTGSGPKGRLLKEDVQRYVQSVLTAGSTASDPRLVTRAPIDFSKFGAIEEKPLGKIRKISAQHLQQSWIGIPHVTQFDEADITELEEFRRAHQPDPKNGAAKLTLLSFLMKASATALKAFPEFCASLTTSGEALILKRYYHIGFAVDTPEGLVVPVIRDVDKKGLNQLAVELQTLAKKARERKVTPAELEGGCFSISSLGHIGGTGFTPIINAPEVAILGVSRAVMKPIWHENEVRPRLILPLSLSYDHRVVDGAAAARFARFLCEALVDLRELLL